MESLIIGYLGDREKSCWTCLPSRYSSNRPFVYCLSAPRTDRQTSVYKDHSHCTNFSGRRSTRPPYDSLIVSIGKLVDSIAREQVDSASGD